ncbi:MAG TPA: glycerophosphodiester phosphodiesterase family protein [Solirubrobacterales bacterium]|nr:glycerophosphodiester phosphodiesterase family protein [Solirubrobacterales bacterium]
MSKRHIWTLTGLIFALAQLAFVATARSAVEIHAHRGGANVEGRATYPENSMSAFQHSLAEGWVIEFDLKVTSDGVPVVMHDDNLDRTTNCTGPVDVHSLAELVPCRIDQQGSGDLAEPIGPGDPLLEPIPTLDQVIELLKRTGGRANIEVKDLAGTHPDLVTGTYERLRDSGIPSSRVILQNFKSGDLSQAKALYPGVATSLLSPLFLNDSYLVQTAEAQGIDWVSPQWPISAEFVSRARAAGKKIVPYTIDDETDMREADALGVDALITNDPTMADRLVGPRPSPPPSPEPKLSLKLGGKSRVRAGGSIRMTARITNSGDAASSRSTLRLKLGAAGLSSGGRDSIAIPPIEAGTARTVGVTLKARAAAKRFGRRPVTFILAQDGLPGIRKVRWIRIQRPSS